MRRRRKISVMYLKKRKRFVDPPRLQLHVLTTVVVPRWALVVAVVVVVDWE